LPALVVALVVAAPAVAAVTLLGSGTQVSSVSCAFSSGGGHGTGSCVFTFSDGRRYSCPSRFGSGPGDDNVSAIEHSRACRALAPLHLSAAVRAVSARLTAARGCLERRVRRVLGGLVLPSQGPGVPAGELIVGGGAGMFLAFYTDAAAGRRALPTLMANARRTGLRVTPGGAVTVVGSASAYAALGSTVRACGLP
jgi:hypothetical protein